MDILKELQEAVIAGHAEASSPYPPRMKGKPGVKELVQLALDSKIEISKILRESLIPGMEIVGNKFSAGECFVPEMLLSAQAMKQGLKIIEPLLTAKDAKKMGTVILGTVQGDMHDIGKNLVGMMLDGAGFQVIDLGINTPPEKFVEMARAHPEAVVGMSALLTTTMEKMRETIGLLRKNNLTNKVIIGGAAVSQRFADEIKADAFSRDAALAVPLVKKMLGLINTN